MLALLRMIATTAMIVVTTTGQSDSRSCHSCATPLPYPGHATATKNTVSSSLCVHVMWHGHGVAQRRPCGCCQGNSSQIEEAVKFADANWNCLDVLCKTRVPTGAGQPVYGCAPFVAHCLAAGGWVPRSV